MLKRFCHCILVKGRALLVCGLALCSLDIKLNGFFLFETQFPLEDVKDGSIINTCNTFSIVLPGDDCSIQNIN